GRSGHAAGACGLVGGGGVCDGPARVALVSLVVVESLTVERDGHAVLEGLCLQLQAAERLVIVGPTGAGKSTLLLALLGLMPARQGRIELLGLHCRDESDFARQRGPIGLL